MKYVMNSMLMIVLSFLVLAEATAQKTVQVEEDGMVVMTVKNFLNEDGIDLLMEFQSNLKVFLEAHPNIEDYSFDYSQGTEMRVERSEVAGTYAIDEDKIENIGLNTATLKGAGVDIVILFEEIKELLDEKWLTYLNRLETEKTSYLRRIFFQSGEEYRYTVENDVYKRERRKREIGLHLNASVFNAKLYNRNYGMGVDFKLSLSSSMSFLGLNTIFVGYDCDVYFNKPISLESTFLFGVGSDYIKFFGGIPPSDENSIFKNDSYMLGFSVGGTSKLSPRFYFDKDDNLNSIGLQFSIPISGPTDVKASF